MIKTVASLVEVDLRKNLLTSALAFPSLKTFSSVNAFKILFVLIAKSSLVFNVFYKLIE